MSKPATTSRILNEQPARGWAKIHAPRYHAVEVAGQLGVFQCLAKGPGLWTAAQLQAWALETGAEVVLMEWVRTPVKQDRNRSALV